METYLVIVAALAHPIKEAVERSSNAVHQEPYHGSADNNAGDGKANGEECVKEWRAVGARRRYKRCTSGEIYKRPHT